MNYYVAYVKEIDIGSNVGDIKFTEKKSRFSNKCVLVESHETRGEGWYIDKYNKCIYHSSWFENIFLWDYSKYLVITINGFIRMAVIRGHNYIDIVHNKVIYNIDITLNSNQLGDYNNYIKYHPEVRHNNHLGFCGDCGDRLYRDFFDNNKWRKMLRLNTIYCPDCHKIHISTCTNCNADYIMNEEDPSYGQSLCPKCYEEQNIQCDLCHEKTQSAIKVGNKYICDECLHEQGKHRCTKCSVIISKDAIVEDGLCKLCYLFIKKGMATNVIHPFDFKPVARFKGTGTDTLFFGIENEIVAMKNRLEAASYLNISMNKKEQVAYFKFDSSIGHGINGNRGEAGFELVTHPFSFEWLKKNKNIFDSMFELSEYEAISDETDTCGMHIHMTKKCFSPVHLYKFMYMIYNHPKFSHIISERVNTNKVETYCSYRPFDKITNLCFSRTNPHVGEARHRAVNLSCPNSVEVRIFRGTLKIESFMKNIEFCKSLFEFTKISSIKLCTVENYLTYIESYKKSYKYLYNFLILKGLIKNVCGYIAIK